MRYLVALVSFCVAGPVYGQLPDLVPGARVRLADTAHQARVEATVIARAGDSLVVATTTGGVYRFTASALTSAELYRGRTAGAGARRGAMWGAAVSAPLAVLVVALAGSEGPNTVGENIAGAAVTVAAYAGIGAIIGAIVGGEEWQVLKVGRSP